MSAQDDIDREVAEPLSRLVRAEAQRALTEAQLAADPGRLAEGWERRFVADGTRAAEMVQLYRELGYEVVADPIRAAQFGSDCADCQLLIQLKFKMIYTRRPSSRAGR